jgi:beta-1,4-mannosyltransferase
MKWYTLKPSRVAFFPNFEALTANPYWRILAESLEVKGMRVEKSGANSFSLRWLLANYRKVNILHLHYIQQFYAFENTQARLRWVIRFARNLITARILGYRTVFTLHNLKPTYSLHPAWVDHLGHWVAANLTTSVIVHCQAARQMLTEEYGRRKSVYVIPLPNYKAVYPNEIIREQARDRLGLLPDQTVFVFFGGLRPNKGIETLINAFQQLPDNHIRLIIAGKPWPPRDYIEEICRLSSKDCRVKLYLEHINDEHVQTFLNAADIVVLPFARILTSSSAMLAMTFGRPVVVPAMGCLPELVTPETGWIYEPDEPEALVKTLRGCLKSDFKQKGEAACIRALSFSRERTAELTLAAYNGA